MANFTSNTYTLKRKILTFTNKISRSLFKPERKFTADITYGMLTAKSCLLTDVVDQLHKDSKKINIVDRLSRHLEKGTPAAIILSAFSPEYFICRKKIINLLTPLLLTP